MTVPDKPAAALLRVHEERLRVTRRRRVTGLVRVHKSVLAEERSVALPPAQRDEIEVQRRPIGRVVDAPAPSRTEGDVTIVPVYEERWVLVRQLVLTEELHLRPTRRAVPVPPQRVTLRREQIRVERVAVPPGSTPPSTPGDAVAATPSPPAPDERTPPS